MVQIVDMIRCKIMEMIYTHRESSNSWREILPSMNPKGQEEIGKARNRDVICSTGSASMMIQFMSSIWRLGSAHAEDGRLLACRVCMLLQSHRWVHN